MTTEATEAETPHPLEWTGVINFKLEREDDPGNLQEYDLCQLIGKQSKDDVKTKLYFDIENYRPPEGSKKDLVRCGAYKRLAQELRQAAFKSGSTIFVNSTGVARKDARTTWKFTCSACRKAKEGQRFKRCTTAKPLPGQKTCKFTFTVAVDERGFYLIQTAGNPNHNGHNRIDANDTTGTLPNRLVSQPKSNNVVMDGGLGSEMFGKHPFSHPEQGWTSLPGGGSAGAPLG